MLETHLSFEDEDDTPLLTLTAASAPLLTVGDEIHLAQLIVLGAERLWDQAEMFSGDYRVLRIEHSFEKRFGANVSRVSELHFMTVTVRRMAP